VLAASIRQALINSTTWQHKQRFAQRSRFIHSPCRDQTGLRASLERRASRDQSQHSTGTRWRLSAIYFHDTPIATNRLCVLETLLSCIPT